MSPSRENDRKRPAREAVSPLASPQARKVPRPDFHQQVFQLEPLIDLDSAKNTMYMRCNDEVHENIDYCPVMKMVMDSWPMQRLRDIRQVGTMLYDVE